MTRSSNKYKSWQIPVAGWHKIIVTANNEKTSNVTFVKEALPVTPSQNASMADALATGETGRHIIDVGASETLTVPSDAEYVVIAYVSNAGDSTPSSVIAMSKWTDKQDKLTFDSSPTENSTNPVVSGGIKTSIDKISEEIDCSSYTKIYGRINLEGIFKETSGFRCILVPVKNTWHKLLMHLPLRSSDTYPAYRIGYIAFLTSNTLTVNQSAPFCSSETNVRKLMPYDTVVYEIPDDCTYIYVLVRHNSSSNNVEPYIWALTEGNAMEVLADLNHKQLPYYDYAYLENRKARITEIQNTISANNDAFLFITDYHDTGSNERNSLEMIRQISKTTGITSLLYAGDSGGGNPSTQAEAEMRLRESASVWDDLQRQVDSFWGALGNHEWISSSYNNRSAMFGAYLNRFKLRCGGMDTYGDYYWDNPINKIRYIALQQTGGAAIDANQLDWLGTTLSNTPNGYSVLVFAHHGYIPNESSSAEYDGATIIGADHDSESDSHLWARRVNQVLHAYEAAGTLTLKINNVFYPFDFTGKSGTVIGVFCGHYHHGTLFEKDDTYNTEQIPVFRGGSDTLKAATVSDDDNLPWYWGNGTIGGTKISRAVGTTSEQCFYAVQIDLDAKKVYITAIGGDHDWEFEYGNT